MAVYLRRSNPRRSREIRAASMARPSSGATHPSEAGPGREGGDVGPGRRLPARRRAAPPPRRLTDGPHDAAVESWSADSRYLILALTDGGDEKVRLHIMPVDGA